MGFLNPLNTFLDTITGNDKSNIDALKIETFVKNGLDKKIPWVPCKKSGRNFITHDLILQNNIIKYRNSKYDLLVSFMMLWMAIISLLLILLLDFRDHVTFFSSHSTSRIFLFYIFPALIFFQIIILRMNNFRKCWSFDKTIGYCYIGKLPSKIIMSCPEKIILLSEISGLQILPEWVSAKNSFTSYEINLILKNFSRVNIIDHSSIKQIRLDAEKIGAFLGVPVWDITL